MTAAYRLKGIGWFGATVAVVLAFYLVSLQVATERGKLEKLNARIATAERDIRALETEFDTRANLAQLEKWNGDTLALSAPTAEQFMADEVALASVDLDSPMPVQGEAVRTAQLVVPSGLPQQAAMTLVAANAAAPAMTATAPARAVAATTAPVRVADGTVARAVAAVAVKARPQAVAMLERKLLSENTLGDILSSARAEAGAKP